MNICVAGWHYGHGIDALKAAGGFVVSHKPHPLADVVIPNVGLEFGCYDHFLSSRWQSEKVLFTHDDNEFTGDALDQIAGIETDQAFLFSSEEEAKRNGYAHGRAFVCSDRFLQHLKADGGFWYDEGQNGTPPTTGAPDYHNTGVQMFQAYLQGCNSGMTVGGYRIVEGMKLGYRGGETPKPQREVLRLNLGCGKSHFPGYINVDIVPGAGVDLVCDIRNLPYGEGTVDQIEIFHVIEHFTLKDAHRMLCSYFKMLRKGGRIGIEGPDVFKAVKNCKTDIGAIGVLFGDPYQLADGHAAMQHLWGWTGRLMAEELKRIGYKAVQTSDGTTHGKPWRDYRVVAVKE